MQLFRIVFLFLPLFAAAASEPYSVGILGSSTTKSTPVSMLFSSPLRVVVRDVSGDALSGITVTFTAPFLGPSGVFSGANSVATDANGVATAPPFTANGVAGAFTVLASVNGLANPVKFAMFSTVPSGTLAKTPPYYPATYSTSGMAVGDFNGDGNLDVATVGYLYPTPVQILFGDGNNGFSPAVGISFLDPKLIASSIAAGDLNGDGKLDLVITTQYQGGSIVVLLGNGSGGFSVAPQGRVPTLSISSWSALLTDVNSDGRLDLVVLNFKSSPAITTASVFLGDGAGGLTSTGTEFPAGRGGVAVRADDFNKDGRPDLAILNYDDNSVTILLGTGTGSFSPASGSPLAIGTYAKLLSVSDLNGDGNPDLIVSASTGILLYFGTGSGDFSPTPQLLPTLNYDFFPVAVADFNGDGYPDIAACAGNGRTTVYLGSASGVFSKVPDAGFNFNGYGTLIATADFNHDGRPDVIEVNGDSPGLYVLLGGLAQADLSLGSEAYKPLAGQSIMFTAGLYTYFPFSQPTALVTFKDGAAVLGTAPAIDGVATLTTSSLTAGTHIITATYPGDIRTSAVTSSSLTMTVLAVPASISATAGTPQSTPILGPFRVLQATVRDSNNNPVVGQLVTFTVPSSGASAGGQSTYYPTTNAQGIAFFNPIANGVPGTYNVTASIGSLSVNFVLTNVSQPSFASFTPFAATGPGQVFVARFVDVTGLNNLSRRIVLFNDSLNGVGGCLVQGDKTGIYLANDADSALLGPLTPSKNLSNGQCTLNGNGSSLADNGIFSELTISITFSASFSGIKHIYAFADETTGGSTGFVSGGNFTVSYAGSTPAADSVSPSTSFGMSQIFTAVFSNPAGGTILKRRLFLINSALNGSAGCFVQVDATGIYLVNDAGTGLLTAAGATNSQCTLNPGTRNTISGNQSTLTADLTFKPAFGGPKTIFMYADDSAGTNTGWQNRGTFTVNTPVPSVVSVSPATGSGSSGTFTATYSDTAGSAALNRRLFLINSSLNGVGACFVQMDSTGTYLLNDADTVLMGPLAAALTNNQCRLDSVTTNTSGNNIAVSLTITFKDGFAGLKSLFLYADDTSGANTGWQTLGSFTVVPSTPPSQPLVGGLLPVAGSGTSQVFTATYSDAAGASSLNRRLFLVNSILSGPAACFVQADATGIYLVNDLGSGLLGPLTGSNSFTNSQCTLKGVGSQMTSNGTVSTLVLAIDFSPGFSGTKNLFLFADDTLGNTSGWQSLGMYNVAGAGPAVVSVSPNAAFGTSQSFTAVYSDGFGAGSFRRRLFLVNSSLSGTGACFVQMDATGIYLVSDAGSALGAPLANASQLSNSQCTLNAAGTNLTNSANLSTGVLSLSFAPAFAGNKNIYLYAEDNSGNSSGWQNMGSFVVYSGPSVPVPASINPGSGSGAGQTFTAVFTNTAGYSALNRRLILFNSVLNGAGACLIQIDAGGITLANDADSALSAPLSPSGVLSNSQCTIAGPGSSINNSGNSTTVIIPLTFKPAFVGAKTIFMYADDLSNNGSGWQAKGTWTTQ